jgi:hypothetical protein
MQRTLDLCLYRNDVPVELRQMIHNFGVVGECEEYFFSRISYIVLSSQSSSHLNRSILIKMFLDCVTDHKMCVKLQSGGIEVFIAKKEEARNDNAIVLSYDTLESRLIHDSSLNDNSKVGEKPIVFASDDRYRYQLRQFFTNCIFGVSK